MTNSARHCEEGAARRGNPGNSLLDCFARGISASEIKYRARNDEQGKLVALYYQITSKGCHSERSEESLYLVL